MSLHIGQQFSSYDEFMSTIQAFQEATRHRFIKHYQKTVQWATQNNVVPPPQPRLKYYKLKMNCSRKESKATGDCGTWFRMGVTKDGEKLEIVALELKECGPPVDETPPPPPNHDNNPTMSPMMQPSPVYYDQQMYQPMEQYQAPPAQYDMATYQQPNQGDMQQGLPLPSFGHLGGFQQPPMVYGEGAPQQYASPVYQQPNYQQVDYSGQQMSAYPPQPLYSAPPAHHHEQNLPQGLPPVPMAGPAPPQNAQALQQSHPAQNQLQAPHMPSFPQNPQMYQQLAQDQPPPPQQQPVPPQQQQAQYYAPMPEVMPPPPPTQHYQEMQPMPQMVAPLPTDLSRDQMAPQAPTPMRPSVVHQHLSAQTMNPYVEQAPGMLYTELGQASQQMFGTHLEKALLDGVQHNDSKPMKPDGDSAVGSTQKPLMSCLESSLPEAPTGPLQLTSMKNKNHSNDQHSPQQQHTQIINLKDLSASAPPQVGSPNKQAAASTLQALLGRPRRTSGSSNASQRSHNSDSDLSAEADDKARGPVPDFHLGALFRSYKQAEQAVEKYASPMGYRFRKIGSMLLKRIEGKEKLKEQFANANADPGIKYFALKFRCVRSRQLTMVSNYVKKKRDDDGQLIETPPVDSNAARVIKNSSSNFRPVGSCNARISFQLNKHGTGLEVKQLDEQHDHPPDDEIKDRFAKGLTTKFRPKARKQSHAVEAPKPEENSVQRPDEVKAPVNALDDSFLNEHLLSDQPEVDLLTNIQSLTDEIDKLSETDELPADLASLKNEDLGAINVNPTYDQKVVPLQNGDAIIGRTVYDDKERGVAIVKAEGKLNDDTLRKDALKRLNGHRETTEEQVVPKDHCKTTSSVVQPKGVDESGKIVPEVFDDEKFGAANDDNADSTKAECSSRAQSIQGDLSKDSSPAIAAPSNEEDDKKTKRLFEREIKKLEINMCENVVTPNAVFSLRKRSSKGGASPEHTSGVSAPAGGTVKKRIQDADLKKGEDDDGKLAEANNNINCSSNNNTCSSSSTNPNNYNDSLDCESFRETNAAAVKVQDNSTGSSVLNNSNGNAETSSRRPSRMRTRGKRCRTTSNGSLLADKSCEKNPRNSRGNGEHYEKNPDVRAAKRTRVEDITKSQHELRACKVLVQMADLPKDFEVYWSKEDIAKQLQDADREECQDILKSLGEIVQTSEGDTLSQHKACLTSLLYHWRAGRPVTLAVPESAPVTDCNAAPGPAASMAVSSPAAASSV
ncbi:uncharacterized protein LOC108864786 [Galendromus occidentalis]|uniref:Uncharacterized protein LOC108864786 n=1 Tax=Galendromus occidentalis TaxID=34638 RepID=A0AAJ7SGN0_9ACAR|nr:uncharacterized protein LOC108864786 [Galendromus occidentalis]